ncbi:MAG TPA: SprT-like domain-containing protein [Thermoanaerobaculia bacterium]|nr:SprT-like domain-containing protein [Thermoanaerobaculia bacterium]
MRSSAQELPRDSRRTAPGRGRPAGAGAPDPRRPVQLDLFGPRAVPVIPAVPLPAAAVSAAPASADPNALRFQLLRQLNRLTGGRLRSLELTDNRRTILSVRPGRLGTRAPLELRIHHSFTKAPVEVLEAVAAFVESKRGSDRAREALVVIREHFSAHRPPTARTRRLVLRPEGTALDLREVFADLNERYFEGRLAVAITWGKSNAGISHSCRRQRTSTLQLGSYSYEDRLIRLHRVLDDPGVPRFVVEAVVYHEMLHADMPPEVRNGRRMFHTPEFRRRERIYRNLGRAERWIGEHLSELLRARQVPAAGKKTRKR